MCKVWGRLAPLRTGWLFPTHVTALEVQLECNSFFSSPACQGTSKVFLLFFSTSGIFGQAVIFLRREDGSWICEWRQINKSISHPYIRIERLGLGWDIGHTFQIRWPHRNFFYLWVLFFFFFKYWWTTVFWLFLKIVSSLELWPREGNLPNDWSLNPNSLFIMVHLHLNTDILVI